MRAGDAVGVVMVSSGFGQNANFCLLFVFEKKTQEEWRQYGQMAVFNSLLRFPLRKRTITAGQYAALHRALLAERECPQVAVDRYKTR